jgi:curli biogenesis system outer membrane secretion channel CsgG
MNFEYATVQNNVAAIFGTNTDVGKGIADMLVEKFVNGGVYTVVERKALDKILAEQNLSNSDRADPATAAKIGRLLGVDAIVVGSITVFGRDDKTRDLGGSAVGGQLGRFGIGRVGTRQSKAVVGLSGRLVSTDTAEILAVANGKGESSRSGALLGGAGGSSANAGSGVYDMTSSNFGSTIIGEATIQAVNALSQELEQNASRLPAKVVQVDGLVADVSGSTLVLNVGSRAGVKIGDKLDIVRVGREIRDPATGRVIRRTTDRLGEIQITEVDDLSSVGTFTGAGAPKVGDAAKTPQP